LIIMIIVMMCRYVIIFTLQKFLSWNFEVCMKFFLMGYIVRVDLLKSYLRTSQLKTNFASFLSWVSKVTIVVST
jgi:hypothetical protein